MWADTIKALSQQRILRRRAQWRRAQYRRRLRIRGMPKGAGHRHAIRGEDGRFRAGAGGDGGAMMGRNFK